MAEKEVNISSVVSLFPKDLEENIDKFLISKLKSQYINTSSEGGYIRDIIKINSYSNIISRDASCVFFNVNFTAVCLSLEKGKEIEAIVKDIYPYGIYLKNENIEIIVSYHGTNTKDFSKKGNTFVVRGKEVKIGSKLKVKIIHYQYGKDKIGCIASV